MKKLKKPEVNLGEFSKLRGRREKMKHRPTACSTLFELGYLRAEEYICELRYSRSRYSDRLRGYYGIVITPVVWLMFKSNTFASLVNKIARKVFIDNAIRAGKSKRGRHIEHGE